MKNKFLFLAVACVALTMLAGCETDYDYSNQKFNNSTIAGIWCQPNPNNDMRVSWYCDLTKDGILTYYEDDYGDKATKYQDGYIVNGPETDWKVRMRGKYELDEATQTIFFTGLAVAVIEQRIGKDQAVIKGCTLYRVKGI